MMRGTDERDDDGDDDDQTKVAGCLWGVVRKEGGCRGGGEVYDGGGSPFPRRTESCHWATSCLFSTFSAARRRSTGRAGLYGKQMLSVGDKEKQEVGEK